MPYESEAQRAKFHELLAQGKISQAVVDEFDKASKGLTLPYHKPGSVAAKKYGNHPGPHGSIARSIQARKDFYGRILAICAAGLMFLCSSLRAADYAGQDLRGSDFTDLNLSGDSFRDADVCGSIFWGTAITGCDFTYCTIDQCDFYNLTGFTAQQLYSSDSYQSGQLIDMLFGQDGGGTGHPFNMRGWDFQGIDLSGTIFWNCDLTHANFHGADLSTTQFFYCIGAPE